MCCILLSFYSCYALATDYCPSSSQIKEGQFNGWEVYISSNGGSSPYQPATPAQIQQLEAAKTKFMFANWDNHFISWGVQNAVCIYTGSIAANYWISKTEPAPTSPLWNKSTTGYGCGQYSVKLCPFNTST